MDKLKTINTYSLNQNRCMSSDKYGPTESFFGSCSTFCETLTRLQYLFHLIVELFPFLCSWSWKCGLQFHFLSHKFGTYPQKVELFRFVSVFSDTAANCTCDDSFHFSIYFLIHFGYLRIQPAAKDVIDRSREGFYQWNARRAEKHHRVSQDSVALLVPSKN